MTDIETIVHLVPTLHNRSAGTTDAVLKLASHQAQLGFTVEVWTLAPDRQSDELFIRQLDPTVKISFFKRTDILRSLGLSWSMFSALYKRWDHISIVHTHLLWMMPCMISGFVRCLKKRSSTKLVFSPHGSLTHYSLARSALKKKLVWALFQHFTVTRCNQIILTSDVEEQELPSNFKQYPTTIVSLGIEYSDIRLPKDNTIVFLSRIDPKKNVDLAIISFLEAEAYIKGYKLDVYGPDANTAYVQRIKDLCNTTPGVTYHGPIYGTNKLKILSKANFLVLPTDSENFGLVIGEAMSVGTTCLTTTSTPWDILSTHQLGWCVDKQNFKRTFATIVAFDKKIFEAYGSRCQSYVRKNYNWHKAASDTINVYRIDNDKL